MTPLPFSSFLSTLESGRNLTDRESEQAITEIIRKNVSDEEIKTFLLALRAKGEALSEVVGAARALRANATPIKIPYQESAVDTCGTGGDGLKTVNISTIAAFVVAGAGVPVAKHGNRSITSACGSADLLEALGIKIEIEPALIKQCIQETNFCFLFAPWFHPAMKQLAPLRKELGVPTLFNLLGPLINPARVAYHVVGVADERKCELYAQALQMLGVKRAWVVHGEDGQDELSTTGPTRVIELDINKNPGRLVHITLTPEMAGLPKGSIEQITGGTPQENGLIAEETLEGTKGPVRDAVVLNAAAALTVANAAQEIQMSVYKAQQTIDNGRALSVLKKVRALTSAP